MKFHTFNFFSLALLVFAFSSSVSSDHWKTDLEILDVLIISDHTQLKPFNLDTSGFRGIERTYVDPSIDLFQNILKDKGLRTAILHIEDLALGHELLTRKQQDNLYAAYDQILIDAAKRNVTIISLHLDAEKITTNDFSQIPYPTNSDAESYVYLGGAQIILDQRNISKESMQLAHKLLFSDFFSLVEDKGITVRPTYLNRLRLQSNISMYLSGGSKGGAALIELGALDELKRLFKTPKAIAENLHLPLLEVANIIEDHRRSLWAK
ncbi:MAG: hypothetical protein VW146_06340 [Gammaproteobacteria bacterium]